MSDAAPKAASNLVESAGRWIALLGALIAAGQAGSAWVAGYWKAEQELGMARVQTEGALATQFLQLILAKDTAVADRALLLDALARLQGHPLQQWATARRDNDQALLARVLAAYERQIEATRIRDATQREAASLTAQLEELNARLAREQENEESRSSIQRERLTVQARLATLQGTLGRETTRVAEITTVITQSERGFVSPTAVSRAATTTAVAQAITADLLRRIAPEAAHERVDIHAPFIQAALQEFEITDRALVAAIVATMAYETDWFARLEEPDSTGDSYESRAGLGNTQPGDGQRFKGRGYLMITGRANYMQLGQRLGLSNGLIISPEDAARPEVAARIAMVYFKAHQDRAIAALAAGDTVTFRRMVNGGTQGLEQFQGIYHKLLAELPFRPADYRVFVQFAGSIERPDVRNMMLVLREAEWGVQGAEGGGERRATAAGTSEVRFGREQDRNAAEALAVQVQSRNVSGRPVKAVLNPSIAPSTLEVWISR
jgi:predicted chitinase